MLISHSSSQLDLVNAGGSHLDFSPYGLSSTARSKRVKQMPRFTEPFREVTVSGGPEIVAVVPSNPQSRNWINRSFYARHLGLERRIPIAATHVAYVEFGEINFAFPIKRRWVANGVAQARRSSQFAWLRPLISSKEAQVLWPEWTTILELDPQKPISLSMTYRSAEDPNKQSLQALRIHYLSDMLDWSTQREHLVGKPTV